METAYEVKIRIDSWDGDFITVEGHEYQVQDGAISGCYIETDHLGRLDVSDDYVSYTDYR